MTEKHITVKHHLTYDGLRHFDEDGNEFLLARQLATVLEYSEFRHFLPVIERARQACRNSGRTTEDHFEDILEMVEIGSGARRELPDVRLSRYTCYLIVQNGDPSKTVIANGQTCFAIQKQGLRYSVRPELVEGLFELASHGLRLFDKLTAQPERWYSAQPERFRHVFPKRMGHA